MSGKINKSYAKLSCKDLQGVDAGRNVAIPDPGTCPPLSDPMFGGHGSSVSSSSWLNKKKLTP